MGKLVLCGCGKHHVKVGNRSTVLWRGAFWDARCAFEDSATVVDALEQKLKENPPTPKLMRIVEKMECVLCAKPVGRGFKLMGDNLYHTNCLHDIGGEG